MGGCCEEKQIVCNIFFEKSFRLSNYSAIGALLLPMLLTELKASLSVQIPFQLVNKSTLSPFTP